MLVVRNKLCKPLSSPERSETTKQSIVRASVSPERSEMTKRPIVCFFHVIARNGETKQSKTYADNTNRLPRFARNDGEERSRVTCIHWGGALICDMECDDYSPVFHEWIIKV